MKRGQDINNGHIVIICPLATLKDCSRQVSKYFIPLVTIAPEHLLDQVKEATSTLIPILGERSAESVGQELINEAWETVARLAGLESNLKPLRLIDNLALATSLLPHRFIGRQFGTVPSETGKSESIFSSLEIQNRLSALARVESLGLPDANALQLLPAALQDEKSRLKFPLSLGVPGVSSRYWEKVGCKLPAVSYGPDGPHSALELETINLLTTHSATSYGALGIMLPTVSQKIFQELAALERHLAKHYSKPNRRFIRRQLAKFAELGRTYFDNITVTCIKRASRIVCFSNFPIGLLSLPGDSATLSCRCPVIYRPLAPLTRALQQQLSPKPNFTFRGDPRILLLEAIEASDKVGPSSRAALLCLKEIMVTQRGLNVELAEVNSPGELEQKVREYKPDILVLSAHGDITTVDNAAGICVGQTFCIGPELGPLPPLVILSSCHTASRGAGTVNVADLLLRQGALAVIASQIPVEPKMNTHLIARFFLGLIDAIRNGTTQTNIADLWWTTATGHALYDIAAGCLRAGRLVNSIPHNTMTIRMNHAYREAEDFMIDSAEPSGEGPALRGWLNCQGYVPETLFYHLIGWPEILLIAPNKANSSFTGTNCPTG